MCRLWVLHRVILGHDVKTETFRGEVNRLDYLMYAENIEVMSGFVLILVWVWLLNFLSGSWSLHFGTEMNVKDTLCSVVHILMKSSILVGAAIYS
jgi:hypothetical protein